MKRKPPRKHAAPQRTYAFSQSSPEEVEEYHFNKSTADAEWSDLHRRVMAMGGIRPPKRETAAGKSGLAREDISGIPPSLIRKSSRSSVDDVAAEFGYDYVSEFQDFVEAVEYNHKNPGRAPHRPRKAPKVKRRRRGAKIVPKRSETKPAGSTLRPDGSKTVLVKAHTRSCPR